MELNTTLANKYFDVKKYQDAIEVCNEILSVENNSIEALKIIAKSKLALGLINDYRIALKNIIEILPDDYIAITELADSYNLGSDIEKAKDFYLKALSFNHEYLPALNNLSNCFFQLSSLKDATKYCHKTIELYPKNFFSYFLLGLILVKENKLSEAEIYASKAVELNDLSFQANLNLGIILFNLKKFDSAKINICKSLDLEPLSFDSNYLLAEILMQQNNFKEAENYFRKAIKIKPESSEAYLNLGSILNVMNNFKEAEIITRKAIELSPHLAEAHYNLGTILSSLGKSNEAESSILKSIELKPKFEKANFNLSIIYINSGRFEEAEVSIRKAIEINPLSAESYNILGKILNALDRPYEARTALIRSIEINQNFHSSYFNLAETLLKQGDIISAFDSYLNAIQLSPNNNAYLSTINKFFHDYDTSVIQWEQIKQAINLILERNDIQHSDCFRALNSQYNKDALLSALESGKNIVIESNCQYIFYDQLIIKALRKVKFLDIKWENILTSIRRNICYSYRSGSFDSSKLEFICALAEHCFINEYVYIEEVDEVSIIESILEKLIKDDLSEFEIALLACYKPLYTFKKEFINLKSINVYFNNLLKLQIDETIVENKIAKSILSLGSITNTISQKVKSQYEENPFPRWRYANFSRDINSFPQGIINNEIKPNNIKYNFIESKKTNILIAGCGTGQQIVAAQRYRNSDITAIDLSRSSLAYSKRKLNELEINNVNLVQMDILDLCLLNKKFDIIECTGVLHHMEDPIIGLRKLLEVSRKDSFLKIALYSEIANRDVIEACDYIEENKLLPNETGIRNFRKAVISGQILKIKDTINRGSFYTTSQCRDLFFHYQAHRYNIQGLKSIIDQLNIEFLGFVLPSKVRSIYKNAFPGDIKQINLNNWKKFEDVHPHTFRGKYQFWLKVI